IDLTWPADRPGLTAARQEAITALREQPVTGRVLVDDIGLGHVLPYYAGLPVLGGLSSQAFLKHRFAGIDEEGILFGRKAGAWTSAALAEYLHTYAVEYAVLSTRPWLQFAQRADSPFEVVSRVGTRLICRVRGGDASYVLDGKASVTADYHGIHVSQLDGDSLVLKFHYADWLTGGPGVRLSPVPILDDPVPFIRVDVDSGVQAFTIHRARTKRGA
ncbi:MAG: hypothetical protein O3A51_03875, partial [Verrucomicrobia bacterium]|nr:hypothetical protein [Verrucomicrobiota bacterium]